MLGPDRRSRPRRGNRHRIGLGSEGLESRRLLVATPLNVAAGLTFAIASPLPGLASGAGFLRTGQSIQTVSATVAPAATSAPAAMNFGPSATGPAPTLSPLANDSKTAEAAASEVARPTPGRSDRISTILAAPEVIPIPHLAPPEEAPVVPGPAIQGPPVAPAPAPVAPLPAEPAPDVPAAPADAIPLPEVAPQPPMTLHAWDLALDLVATEPADTPTPSPTRRAEAAMAAGVLLAAWGGWRNRPRPDGHSRRRPLAIAALDSRSGYGAGR